ncbi:MAG: hypothetical protein ACC661_12960, partial [Verrucomicrobiales bacterium]
GPHQVRYRTGGSGTVVGRTDTIVVLEQGTLEAPAEAPPGSELKVAWSGPDNQGDYITIVGLDAEEGSYTKYAYTQHGSPSKVATPELAGEYEVRYVTGQGGKTLASTPIRILATSATLQVPESVIAGSDFEVVWSGPANTRDFIAVVGKGAKAGDYINYFYAQPEKPADKLRAPETAGEYEVRYMTAQDKRILASVPLIVTATSATVKAPAEVVSQMDFMVEWTGPANKSDFVAIVPKGARPSDSSSYFYTSRGKNPDKLTARLEPGEAEVRYVTGKDKKVLASVPIRIIAATATLTAPAEAVAGSEIALEWTGPDSYADLVTIVPRGNNKRISGDPYGYTRKGNPLKVDAPETPGDYDYLYLVGRTKQVLATASLTVVDPKISLKAPTQASPEERIVIEWTGPNHPHDRIAIAAKGADGKIIEVYKYARNGSPQELVVPKQPGAYEIRYLLGRSYRVITSLPLSVKGE